MLDITITMPSYNETAAIATVVADLQKSLLTATIYVYNNNSGNDTVSRTLAASASKPGACAFWRHPMLSILACNNVDNG